MQWSLTQRERWVGFSGDVNDEGCKCCKVRALAESGTECDCRMPSVSPDVYNY